MQKILGFKKYNLNNNKTKSLSIVCSICFSHTHFVKMSDNGEVYCRPFLFDPDNIGSVLQGNFTAHIHKDGEEVEIRLERGELLLKQTGHDENLDHVFRIEFIQNGEVTCMFWGLLEMEYQGLGKRFTVTSQEFSTEVGVNALRQILPDDNIDGSVLDRSAVSNPSINLNDRFADVASHDEASAGETSGQS